MHGSARLHVLYLNPDDTCMCRALCHAVVVIDEAFYLLFFLDKRLFTFLCIALAIAIALFVCPDANCIR